MTDMTEAEKAENYTRFIEASGWHSTGNGKWRREAAFCGAMSLEGAFHLEQIIKSLEDDGPSAPPTHPDALVSGSSTGGVGR